MGQRRATDSLTPLQQQTEEVAPPHHITQHSTNFYQNDRDKYSKPDSKQQYNVIHYHLYQLHVALGTLIRRVRCRSTGGNPHHCECAFWLLLLV